MTGTAIDLAETINALRHRDVDREGVPMYLELAGAVAAPPDDPRCVEGRFLAARLRQIHTVLTSDGILGTQAAAVDEGPEGGISLEEHDLSRALSMLAWSRFGPRSSRGAEPTEGAVQGEGVIGDGSVAVPEPGEATDLSGADSSGADSSGADSSGAQPNGSMPRPKSPMLEAVLEAFEEGRYIAVVNYHNTPRSTEVSLRQELKTYAERFSPVSAGDLDELFSSGRWPHPRPPLIPVFYEGYRNNYDVAAPICDSCGMIGWFFVITGFVDEPPQTQQAFATEHLIWLVGDEGPRLAMSWDEVAELSDRHVVTSHTARHQAIADVRTSEDFERELIEPSARMLHFTGRRSIGHAWLFGNGLGVSPEHDVALRNAGYCYCFSNTAIAALDARGSAIAMAPSPPSPTPENTGR